MLHEVMHPELDFSKEKSTSWQAAVILGACGYKYNSKAPQIG
jgi:hypothetical protein